MMMIVNTGPSGEQAHEIRHIAIVDGFGANPANSRGGRIGIDASIGLFYAAYVREGENPVLGTTEGVEYMIRTAAIAMCTQWCQITRVLLRVVTETWSPLRNSVSEKLLSQHIALSTT